MQIALNALLFKRLALLYVLGLAVSCLFGIWEVTNPDWAAFDQAFYRLLEQHFGFVEPSGIYIGVAGVALALHIAAALGLIFFNRLARHAFLLSALALIALVAGLEPVSYVSRGTEIFSTLLNAAMGVLLLLSYAKGYGSVWFERSK